MEHAIAEVHKSGFIFLIPLFPLIGAAVNGILGYWIYKKFGEKGIHTIAVTAVILSFLVTFYGYLKLLGMPPEARKMVNPLYTWLSAGPFKAQMAFWFDQLSAVMALTVTFVGSLIHIYSIGYMHKDKSYWRYFAYLNLFMFSMLVLVLANNAILMFVGWEGVGLCSYLLIGFWFTDREKAVAGMKAFITNRVGDFAFIAGLGILFWSLTGNWIPGDGLKSVGEAFGTLNFAKLAQHVDILKHKYLWGIDVPTLVGILFFIGATGKSAQIPLYVWLPDAMAGPTPVSALIHAATMVTAGVYMIARLNFLYALAPVAMTIVSGVGVITALFAATIAITQFDIKKVLAYSTISQLGYMFVGVGVGAFHAGIFHLMTHAFFKALLFLGAGSVIHGMSGEQDIRKMGGLKDKMPYTYWTFLIATLAISGIPPFSGFFSKDEILYKAFTHENPVIRNWPVFVWAVGAFTAFLTAFYMFRLFYYTFSGENRAPEEIKHHIHESPKVMTIPLMVLAFFAAVIGFVGMPAAFGVPNYFERFLEPVFEHSWQIIHFKEYGAGTEFLMMGISIVLALSGWGLAYAFYKDLRSEYPKIIAQKFRLIYTLLYNKYYVDEIYQFLIVDNVVRLSKLIYLFDKYVIDGIVNLAAWITKFVAFLVGLFDFHVIDGIVNGVAHLMGWIGKKVQKIQTGKIEQYIYGILTGIFVLFVIKLLI